MATVPIRITEQLPVGNTTVNANKIETTLTPPRATVKMAVEDIHMRLDPTADGTGNVTFTIDTGVIKKQWVRPFITGLGATMDYSSEIRGALGGTVILTIARTGLTKDGEINWLESQYEGG